VVVLLHDHHVGMVLDPATRPWRLRRAAGSKEEETSGKTQQEEAADAIHHFRSSNQRDQRGGGRGAKATVSSISQISIKVAVIALWLIATAAAAIVRRAVGIAGPALATPEGGAPSYRR
jgi:hypothetical protein